MAKTIANVKKRCVIFGIKKETLQKKGLQKAVVKAWVANYQRVSRVDYVIAVELGTDGVVLGVFDKPKWNKISSVKAKNGRYINRVSFTGKKLNGHSYLHKKLPQDLVPVRNPVKYND